MLWKPEVYSTVSPYLLVRDAERPPGFMEAVFGVTRLPVHKRKGSGGIEHAEARIDDTVVMMGEVPDAGETHDHVYVSDADAAFATAIEAGGASSRE